jgi:hypothetical protein
MKKTAIKSTAADMAEEYDFSGGVRGKNARRYARGANVVVLAPDVAKAFPNAQTVNRSLRALANLLRSQEKSPVR